MAYAFSKVSNKVVDFEINSFDWASMVVTITKLTPNTYVYSGTIDIDFTAINESVFEETVNVYGISAADTYRITFNEDGVYKINVVTTSSTTNKDYIFISKDSLITYLTEDVNNVLSCNPETECHCNETCERYYNFNMLTLLSASYFGDDIDINFNYGTVTSGGLISGYDYKCTYAGSGTRDFNEGISPLLMEKSNFNVIAADTTLVLNTVYTCIFTGTPDAWGATVLTGMTDEFTERLQYIADTMDRIDDYKTNVCSCNCD